jgi:hypothetical protein
VYNIKFHADGRISRYKSRLVALGYVQILGVDYGDTFSPTVRIDSVRFIIAIANQNGWILAQIDINTAYLNADLDEMLFCEAPQGFRIVADSDHNIFIIDETLPVPDGMIPQQFMRIRKATYGLKQSGKVWNDLYTSWVVNEFGAARSTADRCVFT